MPVDFECNGCGLSVSVGWYHDHSFSNGFGSSTLAVCERCGTQHRVEHAIDVSLWSSSSTFFEVAIVEVPRPARLMVANGIREVRGLSPLEAIRLLDSPPIVWRCSVVGALVTAFESVPASCPRCQSLLEEKGGWVS